MKKFFYLCGMMLMSLNIMAQIDHYDRNWDTIVFDDFTEPNRYFDRTFQESEGKWISFSPSLWPSGVTKWTEIDGQVFCGHQVYQWDHLSLITNYAIDRYAMRDHDVYGTPVWTGNDAMVIDYIKVLQLQWDCDNDVYITCQSGLDGFEYSVKKSISITASNGPVGVGNTNKVTFRATDSFEITGPFQVDNGGEMTVIMQNCPE